MCALLIKRNPPWWKHPDFKNNRYWSFCRVFDIICWNDIDSGRYQHELELIQWWEESKIGTGLTQFVGGLLEWYWCREVLAGGSGELIRWFEESKIGLTQFVGCLLEWCGEVLAEVLLLELIWWFKESKTGLTQFVGCLLEWCREVLAGAALELIWLSHLQFRTSCLTFHAPTHLLCTNSTQTFCVFKLIDLRYI